MLTASRAVTSVVLIIITIIIIMKIAVISTAPYLFGNGEHCALRDLQNVYQIYIMYISCIVSCIYLVLLTHHTLSTQTLTIDPPPPHTHTHTHTPTPMCTQNGEGGRGAAEFECGIRFGLERCVTVLTLTSTEVCSQASIQERNQLRCVHTTLIKQDTITSPYTRRYR